MDALFSHNFSVYRFITKKSSPFIVGSTVSKVELPVGGLFFKKINFSLAFFPELGYIKNMG